MIEALLDPKVWLFALFSALDNVPNSLTNQRSLIVSSFGFSNLHTTLLGCVDGLIEILTIYTGVKLCARIPNSRAWVGMIYFLPNVLGVFLINFLPWDNKVGLRKSSVLSTLVLHVAHVAKFLTDAGLSPMTVFSQWLTGIGTTGFVLALSWVGATTSGHTKKITTNAIMLSAYCIGNAAAPFMWQAKYKPRYVAHHAPLIITTITYSSILAANGLESGCFRYHIPWIIIGICYICCIALLFAIRTLLKRRNDQRDAEAVDDTYEDVYVIKTLDNGEKVEVKVAKVCPSLWVVIVPWGYQY